MSLFSNKPFCPSSLSSLSVALPRSFVATMSSSNKMETGLKTILVERNGVHEDTVKWLESKGCLTVGHFANWVDSKSEIKDAIHKNIPTMKDNHSDLSKTKMAWREAEAQISRGVKRSAEGLDNEALDDPLQIEVFRSIKTTFKSCYNWTDSFDSRRIGCDSLHGRFRREFERKQPTMFTILKARSLAKSQKEGQVKKTRLDNNIEIHQKDKDGYDGPASLTKWFACFDIMVNTWAVTGCFDVMYKGESRKYIHWAEAQAYQFEFTIKANELTELHHQEYKIFQYLSTVEEEIRSKAVEFARGESECPWGEALTTARKECAHIWQEKRDRLAVKNTQQDNLRSHQPQRTASFQPPQQDLPVKFCNNFNRGICKTPNCRFPHQCNVILKNGKLCGAKNHGAKSHKEEHGTPSSNTPQGGYKGGKQGKGGKGSYK